MALRLLVALVLRPRSAVAVRLESGVAIRTPSDVASWFLDILAWSFPTAMPIGISTALACIIGIVLTPCNPDILTWRSLITLTVCIVTALVRTVITLIR